MNITDENVQNVHYVYKQTTPVILTNAELTNHVEDLLERVSMMESILYNQFTNEEEGNHITD